MKNAEMPDFGVAAVLFSVWRGTGAAMSEPLTVRSSTQLKPSVFVVGL